MDADQVSLNNQAKRNDYRRRSSLALAGLDYRKRVTASRGRCWMAHRFMSSI